MVLPKNILKELEDAKQKKIPVYISSNGIDIAFQTLIRRIEGSELILENTVKPEFIRKFSSGNQFSLQCKMMRLQSTKVGPSATYMGFIVEENSLIDETRQSERFMFAPDEQVVAEFLNPLDGETQVRKTIMDMSRTGLSVRMNAVTQLFKPGRKFEDVKVIIDKKQYSRSRAEVVYGRKFLDLTGKLRFQVGLKFLQD